MDAEAQGRLSNAWQNLTYFRFTRETGNLEVAYEESYQGIGRPDVCVTVGLLPQRRAFALFGDALIIPTKLR